MPLSAGVAKDHAELHVLAMRVGIGIGGQQCCSRCGHKHLFHVSLPVEHGVLRQSLCGDFGKEKRYP
jgi:hypothetical protein